MFTWELLEYSGVVALLIFTSLLYTKPVLFARSPKCNSFSPTHSMGKEAKENPINWPTFPLPHNYTYSCINHGSPYRYVCSCISTYGIDIDDPLLLSAVKVLPAAGASTPLLYVCVCLLYINGTKLPAKIIFSLHTRRCYVYIHIYIYPLHFQV